MSHKYQVNHLRDDFISVPESKSQASLLITNYLYDLVWPLRPEVLEQSSEGLLLPTCQHCLSRHAPFPTVDDPRISPKTMAFRGLSLPRSVHPQPMIAKLVSITGTKRGPFNTSATAATWMGKTGCPMCLQLA